MRRLLIALLFGGFLAGCALMPPWLQAGSPEGGWGSKLVSFKEEPATLVARDGTVCIVSGSKFANAKEGDRVFCHWQPRGAATDPGQGASSSLSG